MKTFKNFKFYQPLIILSVWLVTLSLAESNQEWVRLDKNILPSSALNTAIDVLKTSSNILNTLENHFGIEEYRKILKVEREAESMLEELKNKVYKMSHIVGMIEFVSESDTKKDSGNPAMIDMLMKSLNIKYEDYDKIAEKTKAFIIEVENAENRIKTFGIPLKDDLIKYGEMAKDLDQMFFILSKLSIELSKPNLEIADPNDFYFDISILEKLRGYFVQIDVIEDTVNEVGKPEAAKNELKDRDKAIHYGQKHRYDILHKKIIPLAKENEEMLGKFNALIMSQLKKIKKLANGFDRRMDDILKSLRSLKNEIVKVDLEFLHYSTVINEYAKKAYPESLEMPHEKCLKDSKSYEEL